MHYNSSPNTVTTFIFLDVKVLIFKMLIMKAHFHLSNLEMYEKQLYRRILNESKALPNYSE